MGYEKVSENQYLTTSIKYSFKVLHIANNGSYLLKFFIFLQASTLKKSISFEKEKN